MTFLKSYYVGERTNTSSTETLHACIVRLNSTTDAEYQRIVWRENEDQPIKEYKLTTVTFGTTPAPFLTIRTIKQLAEDESNHYPAAAEKAITDFYVDDFFSGTETKEEAIELLAQTTKMFDKRVQNTQMDCKQ